ncbi:hypothetical protein PQX77_014429 [Marasmius sp. AFHP31]|nr:hypothetical protein PQX77_014429 [Marasmius sp. AFHP31]
MPSKPAFCHHLLDSDNRCNEAVPEATPQRHFHPRELFRLAFPHRPALEPPHAGENPFSSVFSGDCSLRLRSSGKDEHPNHILKITRVPAIGDLESHLGQMLRELLWLKADHQDCEHPNHILKITRVPAIGDLESHLGQMLRDLLWLKVDHQECEVQFSTLYKNLDFVIFTGLLVCSTATRGLYPALLLSYMLTASPSRVWL